MTQQQAFVITDEMRASIGKKIVPHKQRVTDSRVYLTD